MPARRRLRLRRDNIINVLLTQHAELVYSMCQILTREEMIQMYLASMTIALDSPVFITINGKMYSVDANRNLVIHERDNNEA